MKSEIDELDIVVTQIATLSAILLKKTADAGLDTGLPQGLHALSAGFISWKNKEMFIKEGPESPLRYKKILDCILVFLNAAVSGRDEEDGEVEMFWVPEEEKEARKVTIGHANEFLHTLNSKTAETFAGVLGLLQIGMEPNEALGFAADTFLKTNKEDKG